MRGVKWRRGRRRGGKFIKNYSLKIENNLSLR